ncbi:MAG: hypothetical protein M5U05_18440 [Anaerolineales bacterium]|nr:hypothetical protein [Anaerolineales bacterium]
MPQFAEELAALGVEAFQGLDGGDLAGVVAVGFGLLGRKGP